MKIPDGEGSELWNNKFSLFCVHRAMGLRPKSSIFVRRCHQLLSGIIANDHLPQVSRRSRSSANDKGDNEVKPGAVHKSACIYSMAKETPRKPQL